MALPSPSSQAHRFVIQAVVTGARVLGRSLSEAYKQAVASSQYERAQARSGGGKAGFSSTGMGSMTLDEACKILHVKPPDARTGLADMDDVYSRFKRLFDANEPKQGGSFYLQSKILRARERIEAEVRPAMEKAEFEAEIRDWKPPKMFKDAPRDHQPRGEEGKGGKGGKER